jgi:hypothetical protein
MYGQNSPASHVAMYLGGGYICDATTSGVKIRPLSHVLTDRSWFVDNREQPIADDHRLQIVQPLVGMVGTPYDWAAIRHMALSAITDSTEEPHPRLWADVVLIILATPRLIAAATRGRRALSLVTPAAAYACLLARNQIEHRRAPAIRPPTSSPIAATRDEDQTGDAR